MGWIGKKRAQEFDWTPVIDVAAALQIACSSH